MRWRPFLLSALAVMALLAIAASAAGTRPLSAAGKRSGALPTSLVDYTATTLIIVAFLAAIVVATFIPVGMNPGERRSFPARVLRTIAFVVLGVLFAFMLRHFILHLHLGATQKQIVHGHPQKGHKPVHNPVSQPRSLTFQWNELFVVAGLVLFVLLLFFAFRPQRRGRGERSSAETLAEAISESLDDLRNDPDLRRAIEAAYARMERALAAIGVPRDPAEAPNEYLERALLSVDASAPAVQRLTELFEHVKFSHHEPDARMRDDAIDALVTIRDELAADSKVAA
jgi:cbb3-type cytochrome oxidase subunit 3